MILCITAVVLLFANCGKECKIKYPKDLKPIDWENYNDVYTVYWNLVHCCSEDPYFQTDSMECVNRGTIKISGWKVQSRDLFALCDDAKCAENFFVPSPSTVVYIDFYFPEAYAFLDTCDLTKKCFIKGEINYTLNEFTSRCFIEPKIKVMDINDIYFE